MAQEFDRTAFVTSLSRPIVPVTGVSGGLHMRALTGAEISQIHEVLGDKSKDGRTFTQAIVARTLCDENGGRVFRAEEYELIFEGPAGITNQLIDQALTVNRMRSGDQEPGK